MLTLKKPYPGAMNAVQWATLVNRLERFMPSRLACRVATFLQYHKLVTWRD